MEDMFHHILKKYQELNSILHKTKSSYEWNCYLRNCNDL